MNCPNCGKELMEGSMYCPSCGTALSGVDKTVPLRPGAGQQAAGGVAAPPAGGQQGFQPPSAPVPPGASGGQATPPQGGSQYGFQPPPVPPPPGVQGGQVPPPPGMPYQNVLKNNPMCIAALVLGIASLVFMFGPVFGTLLGIAGIVLGKIGMDQVDERPDLYTGRNMGQVGFVLSIIGVLLNILFTLARFTFWSYKVFW